MNTQPNTKACIHIWVTGRVQGVGFRAFVVQQAQYLKLTGWVRNLGYSQVEAVAEGPREILERFVEILRRGPTGSRVDDLRLEWETPNGGLSSFDVRRSL